MKKYFIHCQDVFLSTSLASLFSEHALSFLLENCSHIEAVIIPYINYGGGNRSSASFCYLSFTTKKKVIKVWVSMHSPVKEWRLSIYSALSVYNSQIFTKRPIPDLSSREVSIINFILLSYSPATMADILNLSVKTIYSHRRKLMSKFKCRTRNDLVNLLQVA